MSLSFIGHSRGEEIFREESVSFIFLFLNRDDQRSLNASPTEPQTAHVTTPRVMGRVYSRRFIGHDELRVCFVISSCLEKLSEPFVKFTQQFLFPSE